MRELSEKISDGSSHENASVEMERIAIEVAPLAIKIDITKYQLN